MRRSKKKWLGNRRSPAQLKLARAGVFTHGFLTGNELIYSLHDMDLASPPCEPRCEDEYCAGCAMAECPHGEPLHRHHDGCPACCAEPYEDHGVSMCPCGSACAGHGLDGAVSVCHATPVGKCTHCPLRCKREPNVIVGVDPASGTDHTAIVTVQADPSAPMGVIRQLLILKNKLLGRDHTGTIFAGHLMSCPAIYLADGTVSADGAGAGAGACNCLLFDPDRKLGAWLPVTADQVRHKAGLMPFADFHELNAYSGRRGGKTTRTMCEAIAAAVNGETACVVYATRQHRDHADRILRHILAHIPCADVVRGRIELVIDGPASKKPSYIEDTVRWLVDS